MLRITYLAYLRILVPMIIILFPILSLAEYVDVNNDGFTDIVYVELDSVIINLNNQGGSFDRFGYMVGNSPSSLCLADLDNDNDLDLAVANESSRPLSVLLNSGDGSFLKAVNYGQYYIKSKIICAGDLNLDGFADIVIAEESGRYSIFKNGGDGTFYGYPVWDYMPGEASSIFCVDMDGDTDKDIVTIGKLISIKYNDGGGSFDPNGYYYDVGILGFGCTVAEFTADSYPDIFIIGYRWGALYSSSGDGTLEKTNSWSVGNTPDTYEPTSCAFADFNNDGIQDYVHAVFIGVEGWYAGTSVGVYVSVGNGDFEGWGGFYIFGVRYYVSGCGDFNGDGILDIRGAGGGYGTMYGLGDGTFESGYITDINNSFNSSNIPYEFSLSQNHPNPFNSSTQFEIEIPRTAFVEIMIYNILGKQLKTLVSEQLPAGHNVLTWDGTDDQGLQVSSGIYFYRLSAEGYAETRKMLLLK